jgi:peptidase E
MPADTASPPTRGPIDTDLLDRIAAHLARSDRFDDIRTRSEYALNTVVADYDLGYVPGGITRPILTTEQQELLDAIINEWQDGCNISSRIG